MNEDGSMSEKQLCAAIRSAIRQAWMAHKTKLSLLYDRTVPDMNPATRTKWLIECEMCNYDMTLSVGEHSLQSLDVLGPVSGVLS